MALGKSCLLKACLPSFSAARAALDAGVVPVRKSPVMVSFLDSRGRTDLVSITPPAKPKRMRKAPPTTICHRRNDGEAALLAAGRGLTVGSGGKVLSC